MLNCRKKYRNKINNELRQIAKNREICNRASVEEKTQPSRPRTLQDKNLMNILRGSGRKRPFLPFRYNHRLAARAARLHRLQRKGLTPPGDKATLRAMCDDAARSHRITRIKTGATTPENSAD